MDDPATSPPNSQDFPVGSHCMRTYSCMVDSAWASWLLPRRAWQLELGGERGPHESSHDVPFSRYWSEK